MLIKAFESFFRSDAAGGILLMLSALAALVIANSPASWFYDNFLSAYLAITLNGEGLQKPLILWINDGLTAVFFFFIGLELKREVLEGKLRNPRDILLPGLAAIGGMAVPALVFAAFNWNSPDTLAGWAIPAATDIAFALGILALVGSRCAPSLKIFLLTVAILDDLGAIVIIALFYTADLKAEFLLMALVPLAGLLVLNFTGARRLAPAILLGIIMWFLVLESGVHATLAGVITAFCIPLKDKAGKSPLLTLEHALAPYVLYMIVPIFAFANAGVVLAGMSFASLATPLTLGITLGLVVGKQLGVFGATFLAIKFGVARLPEGMGWPQVYGVACLAGIGFTMSLFIGSLSFSDAAQMNEVRLGVLVGSLISAVVGYGVLMLAPAPGAIETPEETSKTKIAA